MMNGYYGFGVGSMYFTGIIWIIIWALIIYFIVRLINQNSDRRDGFNPPPPTHKSALDILKERYAKGEITKEQFEEMKKDIM